MNQHPVVGIVGRGRMGSAMANRLLDCGARLVVHNQTGSRCEPLRSRGADVEHTPADVGHRVPIIISCVTDDTAPREVLLGSEGVLAGVQYLRAPISGSVGRAATGSLAFLVSGPQTAYEAARPVLDLLATRTFYLGAGEEGPAMKLALLLVLGATMAAFSEALVLGENSGLTWDSMLDVFDTTAVASPLVRNTIPALRRRSFRGQPRAW